MPQRLPNETRIVHWPKSSRKRLTDRDPRTAQSELWMSRLTPSRAADLSNDEEKHRQPLHSSKLPEWPTLTERTSVLGIRILLFIHRHCGALPFRIVLRMVNAVYWFSSPRLRAVVCDYQQRVDRAAPFLLNDFGTSAPSARSGLAQLERFSLAILEKFCALSGEDHLGSQWGGCCRRAMPERGVPGTQCAT